MTLDIQHNRAVINNISQHYVLCGNGPLVLLAHGFPDSWRVWRHQIEVIAASGYTVVAPDLRGFGESEKPSDPSAYTSTELVADFVGLLNHLGIDQGVIVGHDWGATAAWAAVTLRPDRFPGIATLSVPYSPRPILPMATLMSQAGLDDIYMVYFGKPGAADDELAANPEKLFRRFFSRCRENMTAM